MPQLPVTEIFSSIQGEGPYVGVRQIFLRLPKCNLRCPYCDTPTALSQYMRMETDPGSGAFERKKNPIPLDSLSEMLRSYDFSIHHSLSITGGEPLLWSKDLAYLLPLLKDKNIKIYLETNGTLPEQLLEILPWVDIISMDIKLPFANQTFWNVHETFLRHSLHKEVFVKIVVNEDTSIDQLQNVRDLILRVDPSIQTILQPVTPTGVIKAPKSLQLIQWQSFLLRELSMVRVIPQTHVFMGQL
ncbi:organic radical activating enzyme [Desulfosporosinus orientis DSM 765]|uniref:7-carboxy-7-deazaguanine synthase n=1 Tax=Desulfosporosinus orientis (strain ATCC 19365 / DSM 765 / NCIMB 8382 / VKM B-1628 / Singapore I) TaxID=768706 RepID=G7WDT0_DESOD|nr:7-carboxy-7-deazaguanine synthase QueE [Desulfosporosinus orientis]AET68837.1 organic radical activating enzyme [Desulfosporosinus orientis DSM 765]